MSTYEYTDRLRAKLTVSPVRGDGCLSIHVTDGLPERTTISTIPAQEAPAVALAILEAAGHRPAAWQDLSSLTADERLQLSMYHLKQSEARRARDKERAEQAEREAEDANVRAWHQVMFPGASWADADQYLWRNMYRAARDYFAKEG